MNANSINNNEFNEVFNGVLIKVDSNEHTVKQIKNYTSKARSTYTRYLRTLKKIHTEYNYLSNFNLSFINKMLYYAERKTNDSLNMIRINKREEDVLRYREIIMNATNFFKTINNEFIIIKESSLYNYKPYIDLLKLVSIPIDTDYFNKCLSNIIEYDTIYEYFEAMREKLRENKYLRLLELDKTFNNNFKNLLKIMPTLKTKIFDEYYDNTLNQIENNFQQTTVNIYLNQSNNPTALEDLENEIDYKNEQKANILNNIMINPADIYKTIKVNINDIINKIDCVLNDYDNDDDINDDDSDDDCFNDIESTDIDLNINISNYLKLNENEFDSMTNDLKNIKFNLFEEY